MTAPNDTPPPPQRSRQIASTAARAAAKTPHGRVVLALLIAVVLLVVVVAGATLLMAAAAEGGPPPLTDMGTADVPAVAVTAYFQASTMAPDLVGGCAVRPSVVAAIGRVESIHGTLGGSAPQPDGTVAPPIIGIALNGQGPVAAIRDTDNGQLDADTVWDRAVGPMQFIPSSWALFGVDGNGDGIADPHNLFDAAAAAVVHLCQTRPVDLNADTEALAAAIRAYNHSDVYVSDVLSFVAIYDAVLGDGTRPVIGPGADAQVLLAHPGFTGTPGAINDLQSGVVDGRLIAILVAMADRHPMFVGGFKTYHSQCVGGGSRASRPDCTESHHYHGRGVDIMSVTGQPVTASNSAAYDLVTMLATTAWPDPTLHPDVGSPWPEFNPLPGFFHNDAHRDHIHVDVCGPRYRAGIWTDSC